MIGNPHWIFFKDGLSYQIRFFDSRSRQDLTDLKEIVENPEAQRWMDNVQGMEFWNYRDWMNETGQDNNFLFAIADHQDGSLPDPRIQGFIYIYPSQISQGKLEISFAKRPGAPSGLIVPAIGVVSKYLHQYFSRRKPWLVPALKIIAEIERGNVPSIRVAEKSGFTMIRDYDETDNALWSLNVSDAEHQPQPQSFDQLTRVRQLNGSYCGPAVIQTLLSHFGINVDQEEVVEASTTKEHVIQNGMSVELLAKAVKNINPNLSFWVKRGATITDLTTIVREHNYPVGVDWQGIFGEVEYEAGLDSAIVEDDQTKGDDGHYCVVVDVDESQNQITMRDPYGSFAQQDRTHSLQTFLERWWDDRMDTLPDGTQNYVYENHLIFVILPQNIRFPESLGMTEI